jgi:hypothetical protein
MAFVNTFMKNLSLSIGDLAKWLEEQHQVPTAEIINKWNGLTGMNIVLDENGVDVEDVGHVAVSVNRSKSNHGLTCKHVFINGKRRGQQCAIRPKGGAEFCSSHKTKDSEDEAKKPKKPKPKKTDNKSKEKTKAKKSPKSPKTVPTSDSDSEPEPKPQKKKKSPEPKKKSEPEPQKKKSSKTVPDSDSEPEPPKPQKKKSSNGTSNGTGLRTQSGAGNTGVLSHSGGGLKAGKAGNKTSSDSELKPAPQKKKVFHTPSDLENSELEFQDQNQRKVNSSDSDSDTDA